MVKELKKRTKHEILIIQKMCLTFALCQKEMWKWPIDVEVVPIVSEVLERWPALFLLSEVKESLNRKYLDVVVFTIKVIFVKFLCLLNEFIVETCIFLIR